MPGVGRVGLESEMLWLRRQRWEEYMEQMLGDESVGHAAAWRNSPVTRKARAKVVNWKRVWCI